MSKKDILLAMLVPCLLGFGFVISKEAMISFPPILLNGLRWSLSGILMCYFFPFPKNFIKQMFFISLIGGSIQYSLSFYGLKRTSANSTTDHRSMTCRSLTPKQNPFSCRWEMQGPIESLSTML